MIKLITFILCVILINELVYSQCDTLKVFHASGNIYKRINNTRVSLINDEIIHDADLIIENNSQLILFDLKGKPFTFNQPGEFSPEEIKTKCKEQEKSLTDYYFHYIWCCLSDNEKKEKNVIKAYVSRGKDVYMKFPCDSSIIIEKLVSFKWRKEPLVKSLYLAIYDPSGKMVFSKTTSDTIFNWSPKLLLQTGYYSWIINDDENIPDNALRYTFSFANNEWKLLFDTEFEELSSQLFFDPAINKMLLAGFYDDHYLFQEAYDTFQEAISILQSDDKLNVLFSNFKIRKNLP